MAFVYDPATGVARDAETGLSFHVVSRSGGYYDYDEERGDFAVIGLRSPDYEMDINLRLYGCDVSPTWSMDTAVATGPDPRFLGMIDTVAHQMTRRGDGAPLTSLRDYYPWAWERRDLINRGIEVLLSAGGTTPFRIDVDVYPPPGAPVG